MSKSSNNIRNVTYCLLTVTDCDGGSGGVWCENANYIYIYICCTHKTLPDITGRHFRYGRSSVGDPVVVVFTLLPLFFLSTLSVLTGYIRAYKRRSSPGPLHHSRPPIHHNIPPIQPSTTAAVAFTFLRVSQPPFSSAHYRS